MKVNVIQSSARFAGAGLVVLVCFTALGAPAALPAMQAGSADSTPAHLDTDVSVHRSAFEDSTALEIFTAARRRWLEVGASIRSYEAIRQQRVSAALRTPLRDRTLFHAEAASRVWWSADGSVVEQFLGSRQTGPDGTDAPGELISLGDVYDPTGDPVFFGSSRDRARREDMDDGGDGDASRGGDASGDTRDSGDGDRVRIRIEHYLAPGSERHYRYRTGDSLRLSLPDGRTIRSVGIEVIPRRRSGQLLSGVLWVEPGSGDVVRTVYRLATSYDLEVEGAFDDAPDARSAMRWIPGVLRPIEFDASLVVVEYALWDFQYWMPRRVRAEGMVRAGVVRMPALWESTYRILDVVGADGPADASEAPDGEAVAERWRDDGRYGAYRIVPPGEGGGADGEREGGGEADGHRTYFALEPVDSTRLHDERWLPPPIWEDAPGFADEEELDALADILLDLRLPPVRDRGLRFRWGLGGADLVRYNRAEGLSTGARATHALPSWLGPGEADATARLGIGTWVPDGSVELRWGLARHALSLSGRHAVTPVDPKARSLGIGNSATALVVGRDDGDYFRTTGVRLSLRPEAPERPWWEVSLSAEDHRALPVEAEFAVSELLGGRSNPFRPALAADRVREYGITLRMEPWWGSDPFGVLGGLEVLLQGAEGDRRWGRASGIGRLALPLVAELRAGVELGGGHTWGDAPLQRSWFLGGTRTLRGYPGASAVGRSYGRARLDLSHGTGAARVSLFGDAGWAGDPDVYDADDVLVSAGAGLSFLDGLVRVDLARALRAPTGWRLEIHLDAFH